MSTNNKKAPKSRSMILVLIAWAFIGGQALLAAGSVYNMSLAEGNSTGKATESSIMPWDLLGQAATKTRLVAMQAQPDVIGDVAIFLAVANALGLIALTCALLSWSRSGHLSGKLTIAAATTVILVNSLLNLAYV